MNLSNFTIKSQEAIQQAVQLATQNGQQAIEAVHLLKSVIMTGESVANFIFQKTGCQCPEPEPCVGCTGRFAA